MKNFLEDAYSLPSYPDLFRDAPSAFYEAWQMITWHDVTPSGWRATLLQAKYSSLDLWYVLVWSVLWTVMRTYCTSTVFQRIINWSGLKGKAAASLPESLWKLSFYVVAWGISAYLVLVKYDLFSNPINAIRDWKVDSEIPLDIYCVYVGQTSFYIHSIYATLFQDKWRKDSVVLLFHHIITIFLISVSYLFRYTYLGVLVLFLHDLSDVFLEFTKLSVYYKSKGGKWEQVCDVISSVGFILFGFSWFIFRLYWFPLKVIYITTYVSRKTYSHIVPPFYFGMNILLFFLLALHAYWFKFILEMTYRVITGKAKQVEDVREKENEHYEERTRNNTPRLNNGALKKTRSL